MNKTVQGMRAVAMLAIFLFHAGMLPNGYFPVTFFFMLSGFGIYTAKHALPEERLSWKANLRWQWGKLKYFYVIHLILLFASIPVRWQELQIMSGVPLRAVLAMTLTQSWWPEYSTGFNNLSWFLSTLMFVYLIAFWAVRRVRGCKHTGLWAAALLLAEVLVNLLYAKGMLPEQFVPYFNPLYRAMDLLLGMLAAKYLLSDVPRRTGGTGSELLVILLLGAQYVLYLPCERNLPAVFAPAFFAAICVFGQEKGLPAKLLQAKPLQWLARYGFEFYMAQELLVLALRSLTGLMGLAWRVRVLIFVPGAFAGALLFAVVCQKWLKPLVDKRKL